MTLQSEAVAHRSLVSGSASGLHTHLMTDLSSSILALNPSPTGMLDFSLGKSFTVMPGANCTLSATGGVAGMHPVFLEVITTGSTSRTVNFALPIKSQGPLSTGTGTNKRFGMVLFYDGQYYVEMGGRGAAM